MRVVIESPYSGDVERNVKYARRALLHSLQLGETPFASHLLYTQVLDDNIPEERERGLLCNLVWLKVAEKVVFYTDYGWSEGMEFAFKWSEAELKPFEIRKIGLNG